MSLLKYVVRRLLSLIPILFGVLFLSFALSRAMPGNPYMIKMGEHVTDSQMAVYLQNLERLKLDEPVVAQFFIYYQNCLGVFWAYLTFAYMGGSIIYSSVNGVKEIRRKMVKHA
ncbi:MAG: hypothetical protein ACTSWW_02320 [Promethearchaeota archaeon]